MLSFKGPRFKINWTRPPKRPQADVNTDEMFGTWRPMRPALEELPNAMPGTPQWLFNEWVRKNRQNEETILPGSPVVGGGRWPWQSIRPPGWYKPATPTEAGETVTAEGLVVLEPPTGYEPGPSRMAATRSLGQQPLASWNRPQPQTAGQQPLAAWDRSAAFQVDPQQIIAEIDAARRLQPTGSGPQPSEQAGGLDVYTGIPTADQVWEDALLPLMSNRAFNDVIVEFPEVEKAMRQPGISQDEGTMAMRYGMMGTLAQNAMAAALADLMNREAENREYQNALLDLSNQYGAGLAGIYESMVPDWTEWLRALLGGPIL